MFRVSQRSVSDRVREHVCVSCFAQGLRSRNHALRPFHSTAVSRAAGFTDKNILNSDKESKNKRGIHHKDQNATHRKTRQGVPRRKSTPIEIRKVVDKKSDFMTTHSLALNKASARESEKETPHSVFTKYLGPKEGGTINSKDLTLQRTFSLDFLPSPVDIFVNFSLALDVETSPVPRLSYGLERVLFNPGVYTLRDPRSRVYNFDPYLGSIMPVTEFDFTALKDYITSSKDHTLRNIALKKQKKYVGSSSSMTSALSHFHYLLSAWRPIDIGTMSQSFPEKLRNFTRLLRAPSAMFLRYQDGVYAVDADKEFDSANILMNLGKSMEKLLTLPKEDFERYRRSSANKISAEEEQAIPESYHYSTLGDFVMRSQLDAYDPRLPGTGMFDLKTRAVVSIRMDAQNFEDGVGYEIRDRHGGFESYEREFYDMIRAAFLKYSLQVRIGRMDGIFVAFHNIQRIFGFQYVSLNEMDSTLHGQKHACLGDQEFRLSVALWNKVLDKVTAKYPKQSVRLHFETRDSKVSESFMYIFAEPVTDEEIHAIQTKNQEEIDAYQRRILNLAPHEDDAEQLSDAIRSEEQEQDQESELANESSEPTDDELTAADQDQDQDQEFAEAFAEAQESAEDPENRKELLGLQLIIRNKVNGQFVTRPERLKPKDEWTVEYGLNDMEDNTARLNYKACQIRRAKAIDNKSDSRDPFNKTYLAQLRKYTLKGRAFRNHENVKDKDEGIVVLDDTK
ncbi:Pet127 family protein [Aspergillus affinis]|uniref:Pet127 family protein n=1 Tax=Aspergillus affinis TaxID=1070780 RepID=UPI0022FE3E98|nr:Pet127-domain-containing protein [Aspergillus affinis]KAI9040933.1 Pet127-domain-containing protein [Aspergillus affinis]